MGFGFLFVGYLLTLNFAFESLTLFPALCLMLVGLFSLAPYHRAFREARLWGFVLAAFSSAYFVAEIVRMAGGVGEELFDLLKDSILLPAITLLLLVFHDRLLRGCEALCEETELPKLQYAAKRNRFLSWLAFSFYLLLSLPLRADWYIGVVGAAFLPVFLFRLAVGCMNAYLIWRCYMWICRPEDVDMARRQTGIEWIDRRAEEADRREAEKQEAKKRELAEVYRARQEKYRQKQQGKGKKK